MKNCIHCCVPRNRSCVLFWRSIQFLPFNIKQRTGMSITCCITNKIYTLLSACLLPSHAVSTPARVDPLVSSGSSSGSQGERGRERGRGRGKGRGKRPSIPRKRRVVKPGLKSQGRVIHHIGCFDYILATMVIAKSSKNY